MARVLVTGIGGFTGRYMAAALSARGHVVIGVGRDAGAGATADLAECHELDLEDLVATRAVLGEARPDRVVHLAAVSFVAHDDIAAIYRSNLIASRNLLQALAERHDTIERVLLASSANVYGNAREGILDEDCPALPANDYAVSKLAMEHLARIYAPRVPSIVARPFNYTGVGQSPSFLIPKLVEHVRNGKHVLELGNLDVARDFSDVRTMVDCYARLLDSPQAVGGIFNVCSGVPLSLRDVVGLVETLAGVRFEISVNPALVRESEVRSLAGNRARLETMIGPVGMPPLEQTIRWMLDA
ncbi:NAD-dependent epimerase/dehydratase family protein [Novosphingobium sp.]|uniref:NAD-dependent epimerase/dehydratase family protein n=1 Tax=Novosphingobium sp. TaxID=1874826 RepID=UPI0025CF0390|nr:NAD-dependent epimerase/dehydratase family protein [Novosphingobium sp.]